jgi:hypothetical protein
MNIIVKSPDSGIGATDKYVSEGNVTDKIKDDLI